MDDLKSKTILLVEDEMVIALDETLILENNGYNVITAVTGQEAVEFVLAENCIDLILMDINLGDGADGIETAEKILAMYDIPVVFLSSHTEKDIVKKTETVTSYGYIVKNSGETVMLASIKMALRLFETRQQVDNTNKILDLAFNSINDAIALLDMDGRVEKCNIAFEKFVGKTRTVVLGGRCMELIHKDGKRPQDCPFVKMKHSLKREKMNLSVDGKCYSVAVDPLFDHNGKLVKAVHIISDVTDYIRNDDDVFTDVAVNQVSSGLTFSDLFNIESIQKLQDDFSAATGVASMFTSPDGTPITNPSNFTRLCDEIIRSTEKGADNCKKSCAFVGKYDGAGMNIRRCSSGGLWDAGACITVGGEHIANWLIGQVRCPDMTDSHIKKYAEEIGADIDAAVEAFHEVKVMEPDQIKRIADLMDTSTTILSEIAFRNMQKSKLLAEKEILVKEVHHRLKNNMALIESLLSLQLQEISSEEAYSIIRDTALRVNSVRILYETLLSADEYENLPVEKYIMDIINGIRKVYSNRNLIKIKYNIDLIELSSKTLFKIGLIVNEIITNIYKHAFTPEAAGEIVFRMKKPEQHIEIEITDNGKGLSPEFNIEKNSLGILLIKMFAEQMKGEFTMANLDYPHHGTLSRVKIQSDL